MIAERRTLSLRWPVAVILAAYGCGVSRGSPSVGAPAEAEGVYEFTASIPARETGSTLRVRGTLSIIADSMYVQTANACAVLDGSAPAPTGSASGAGTIRLGCSGAFLMFERRNPAAAKWYATVSVPRQRNVCVEEEVREARRRVCVRRRPETYYTPEQRTGGIQVRRIS